MSWKIVTRALTPLALALVLAAPARAACPGPAVPFPYPVVLKGPAPPRGSRVDSFAAWSRRGGAWRAVPIQIEEVNSQGDYVLSGGLPFTKNTGTGWFNERDELVVAGEDLGDDFRPADLGTEQVKPARASWHVAFCRGGRLAGHLLVQSLQHAQPWKGAPAVRFDRREAAVTTDLYGYKFAAANPVLLGEVTLAAAKAGGKPAPVIQDSRFLMPLKTPFWLPDLTFKDKDFTSSIESWQSGPLRTIVAVGVKYTSFLSLFKLHLFSELVFYKNRFVIPTVIQFVFDPSTHLKPGSGIAYSLRFPPGKVWTIDSNLASLPRTAPDDLVEGGRTAADTEVFYAKGHSVDGSFQVQVRVDAKARRDVPPPFLLRAADFKSPEAAQFWPWLNELAGDLGVFLDFSRIREGTYNFGLDLLLSSKANETFTDYGSVDAEWQVLPARP